MRGCVLRSLRLLKEQRMGKSGRGKGVDRETEIGGRKRESKCVSGCMCVCVPERRATISSKLYDRREVV